ncbi:choice-of-anchor D domain-containing protein [bacterium]|nr:choice-of-anchor D domain-containing protein [bacterium]
MLRILVLVLCMGLCSTGQGVQAQDTIGMFFDADGLTTTTTTTLPYQAVTGWLLLLDASQAEGVNSWECEVRATSPGPEPVVTWEVLGTNVMVSPPPFFQVGMGAPHPWAPVIALARANILVPEPGQKVVFRILPFDPPSMADPPGYPVYKPVYGSGAAVDLYPLEIAGGCATAPVAWINPDGIDAQPRLLGWPGTMYFGGVDPGSYATMHFTLRNPDTIEVIGTLSLDMAETAYTQEDLYYTTMPTSFRIGPGRELTIWLMYHPTTTDPTFGTMTVAFCGESRTIELVGGLDIDCTVFPNALDFGTVGLPDRTAVQAATVNNRGDVVMDATPRFLADSPEFTWEPSTTSVNIDPAALPPGSSYTVWITYAPVDETLDVSSLVFGDGNCGEVRLEGRGVYLPPSCSRSALSLDFGQVLVDTIHQKSFTVTNKGGGVLEGEVSLDDASGEFSLLSGEGPFALEYGDTVTVEVQFAPHVEQSFVARVELGTECGGVTLYGECTEPYIEYAIYPSTLQLDWGVLPFTVGSVPRTVRIYNRGSLPVTGDMQISGDAGFSLMSESGPYSIPPGENRTWSVGWTPSVFGEVTALVSTGLPGGEAIACRGFGVEVLPGSVNRLGFYFDPAFATSSVRVDPGTELTGYLVIENPVAPVDGWELVLSMEGTAQFLDWTFEGGASGDLGPDLFRVQLAEPLPSGGPILLGTVRILVPDILDSTVRGANPPDPVIPGYASYSDADHPGNHLPLGYNLSTQVLASINDSGTVPVDAPSTPTARTTGGEVALEWYCGDDPAEGYHIWRRLGDGQYLRLTGSPVICADGFGAYVDRPEANTGTILSYALSAVRGGRESALSVAAEVILEGAPPQRTLLLATYPNPFNPQTTVPFIMAEPGHARLAVYDLAGRLVRVLLDEDVPAGLNEKVWLGRDGRGRPVPSGVYYLRLDAGGRVDMGKTMLLK